MSDDDLPEFPTLVGPRDIRTLTDRLSEPIEEASLGVSALLAKIVRQSIRGGIQKIDEGLEETVQGKVDEDLRRRGPEIAATARTAAKEEMGEQVDRLWTAAKESGQRINAHLARLDEAVKQEQEARRVLVAEAADTARQLRLESGHLRDDVAGATRQVRGEVSELLSQQRAEVHDLVAKARESLAAGFANVKTDLDRAVVELTGRLAQGQERVEAEIRQARSDLFRRLEQESGELLRRLDQATKDLDRQHRELAARVVRLEQVTEQQRHVAGEQGKAIQELAERLAAVEEKVHKPGILGRISGMFRGKKPEGG